MGNEDLLKKIKESLTDFFAKATPEDIKKALEDAGYKTCTGIDPRSLDVKPLEEPISFDEEVEFTDDKDISSAWQIAFETRACPTDKILFGDKTPELKAHLNICHICEEKLSSREELSAWSALGESMRNVLSAPPTIETREPQVGEIWSLSGELEGWGEKNLFHRAPEVLIIGSSKNDPEKFEIAQVYTDDSLQAEGDISLGEQYGFAEPWNIYSIRKKDLKYFWGKVPPETVKKVIAESESPAPIFDPSGLISLFRNLETETGSYFIEKIAAQEMAVEEQVFQESPGILPDLPGILKIFKDKATEISLNLKSRTEYVMSLSLYGMDFLRSLQPDFALVTRGVARRVQINNDEASKVVMFQKQLSLVPINFQVYAGGIINIEFTRNRDITPDPLGVKVLFKGSPVEPNDVAWEGWEKEYPVLAIRGCKTTDKEAKGANELVRFSETDNQITIEIFPPT